MGGLFLFLMRFAFRKIITFFQNQKNSSVVVQSRLCVFCSQPDTEHSRGWGTSESCPVWDFSAAAALCFPHSLG